MAYVVTSYSRIKRVEKGVEKIYTAWDAPDTDSCCLCCGVVCHSFSGNNVLVIKGKDVRLCDACFDAMQSVSDYMHSRVVSKLIHYSVNVNAM